REDHVDVSGRLDQLGVRVRWPRRSVERATEDHLVPGLPERLEFVHGSARRDDEHAKTHGSLSQGFVQMTFRSACRFSPRTTRSARAIASGSLAGSSTRSPYPPHACATIS